MTDDIKAIRDALAHIANANRGEGVYGLRSAANNFSAVCHPERIARLLDALELAQKDAERYRWLRDDPPVTLSVRRFPGKTERGCYLDGPALDAAIDAAIDAAMKGQE